MQAARCGREGEGIQSPAKGRKRAEKRLQCRGSLQGDASDFDLVERLVSLVGPHVLDGMNDVEASGCAAEYAMGR